MKSNIPSHISTCIVSHQMENSESRQRVISLGKVLISEYNEESSGDSLTKWLIHYIAEKLESLSNLEGQHKLLAEQQCVDVILKLWSNRDTLPDGLRPFENFDPILRGLARLDYQPSGFYYNEFTQFDHDIDDNESTETKQWVANAIKIDEGARVLVKESFNIAAEYAKDEKTRDILKKLPTCSDDDLRIIVKLYDETKSKLSDDEMLEKTRSGLKSKLIRINSMKEVCVEYAQMIELELEKIDDVSK